MKIPVETPSVTNSRASAQMRKCRCARERVGVVSRPGWIPECGAWEVIPVSGRPNTTYEVGGRNSCSEY